MTSWFERIERLMDRVATLMALAGGAKHNQSIADIYMGSLSFVVAMRVVLALVIAFPGIALWLVTTADFAA